MSRPVSDGNRRFRVGVAGAGWVAGAATFRRFSNETMWTLSLCTTVIQIALEDCLWGDSREVKGTRAKQSS